MDISLKNLGKILPLQHHRIHLQTAPCTQPSLQPRKIQTKTLTDLYSTYCYYDVIKIRHFCACFCWWFWGSTLERTASSISGGLILHSEVIHEQPLKGEIKYNNSVGWYTRFFHCEQDSNSSNLLRKAPGGRLLYNMANSMLRPAEIFTGCIPVSQSKSHSQRCPVLFVKICWKCLMNFFLCLLPGCHIIHQPTSKRATEPGKGFKTLTTRFLGRPTQL